ncbi:UdgX family uracil-DNA binding protein [Ideonella sp. DXS29W]|uniref:Type-4 uracil-DNA glycosylase n=1 Tax=Ideonella lacteola TaxID=2984193 RepID=A0ABU9BSW9_9BURK
MRTIELLSEVDVAGWRRHARALWQAGVSPDQVQWRMAPAPSELPLAMEAHGPDGYLIASDHAAPYAAAESAPLHGTSPWQALSLFDALDSPAPTEPPAPPTVSETPEVRRAATLPRVPAAFVALAEAALLHSDPQRFSLLYRLLWRLQHEPLLRGDTLDSDWVAASRMARAVHHCQHKMRAFVRFHERRTPEGPQFVAWFEPQHHTLESQASFFQRRFASMRWAIFTPRVSIAWDGARLHQGGPARRDDIPLDDDKQALWLTYYASIFNPARLKLGTMTNEMPRRYWHNLPEARLIAPLAARAAQRAEAMVAQPATVARRRPRPAPEVAISGPTEPAHDISQIRAAASACQACPLGARATQMVWGEGPAQARVMLVGEQPGDREDLQGQPFVGPAGELLDRALKEAGLDRGALYLTNAVKHFGFDLRGQRRLHKTPGQLEILACRGWLEDEIAAVQPQHIVALGVTAAQALLGARVRIEASRGQWQPRPDGRTVLVTWHPAALLRMPAEQREATWPRWVEDLARAACASGPVTPESSAATDAIRHALRRCTS